MAENGRHGCLSAFLWVMVVANSALALVYLLGAVGIHRSPSYLPAWAFFPLAVLALFNLACAIALLRWKKWGFWGFCISSLVVLFVNLSIGVSAGQAVLGLLGALLLFGVLHIGKENKGWPQLR